MYEKNKILAIPEEFGTHTGRSNVENIVALLKILADFDVLTNISKEDVFILYNGVFFTKWVISSYPEHIRTIQSNYNETWKKFT